MAAFTSVPIALISDKNIKDFDIRVYITIAQFVNEIGYTKIKNQTLCYKLDKSERPIQRALDNLIKHKWLVRKENVRKNSIYDEDCKRVIWLEEFYRKYDHRTREQTEKTKENDFNKFVAWLKTEAIGIVFPVNLGGLVQKYMIRKTERKTVLHVQNEDSNWIVVDSYDSNDIYKKMFRNRGVIMSRIMDVNND